jgi:hypothetical protein
MKMNLPKVFDVNMDKLIESDSGDRYCAYVPLKKITFAKWSDTKMDDNYERIKRTGCVPPIMLGDGNTQNGFYPIKLDNYPLIDGNHRCEGCKKLGYTHIPSIIPNYIDDSDFIIIVNRRWHNDSLKHEYIESDETGSLRNFWMKYWEHFDNYIEMASKIRLRIKSDIKLTSEMVNWVNVNSKKYMCLSNYERDEIDFIKEQYKI